MRFVYFPILSPHGSSRIYSSFHLEFMTRKIAYYVLLTQGCIYLARRQKFWNELRFKFPWLRQTRQAVYANSFIQSISIYLYISLMPKKEIKTNIRIFSEFTSKQISDENTVLVSDLYRLIKKYQAIRTIVRILVVCKHIIYLLFQGCISGRGTFIIFWLDFFIQIHLLTKNLLTHFLSS